MRETDRNEIIFQETYVLLFHQLIYIYIYMQIYINILYMYLFIIYRFIIYHIFILYRYRYIYIIHIFLFIYMHVCVLCVLTGEINAEKSQHFLSQFLFEMIGKSIVQEPNPYKSPYIVQVAFILPSKYEGKVKEVIGFSQNGYTNLMKLTNFSGISNYLLLSFSQLPIKEVVTQYIIEIARSKFCSQKMI